MSKTPTVKQAPLAPPPSPDAGKTFAGPVTIPPAPVAPQSDAERAADLDAVLGPDTPPMSASEAEARLVDGLPPVSEKWYQDDENLRRFWDGITSEAWALKYDGNVRELTLNKAGGTLDKWPGTGKELFDAVRELMLAATKPAAKPATPAVPPPPATDVPVAAKEPANVPQLPQSVATAAPVQIVAQSEAPVVMFIKADGDLIWHGYRWSLTLRAGATPEMVEQVFATWERVLDMPDVVIAASARHTPPQPLPQQPAPVTVAPSAPVLPTAPQQPAPLTYAPLPETVATSAPAAASGAPDKKGRTPGQTGTDRVTAIARTETNGKTIVEVYCGGKYSDHKLRRDEDVALLRAALPTLDIPAMVAGTQYPVTATLTWRVTDKLNDKGTYWRDVVSIVA